MLDQKYKCPNCNWVGVESEMDADHGYYEDGGEFWTNWMCPDCGAWHSGTHDYIKVKEDGSI